MSIRFHVISMLMIIDLLAPFDVSAEPVEIIALGDIPYGVDQALGLDRVRKEIRDGEFPFVVHYGDVKSGSESCNTDLLTGRRDAIYALAAGRVFYTPGDNDWTDCDRREADEFNELERLALIRWLFFEDGRVPSLEGWNIVSQRPDYPENMRWTYADVQFATLHIVGSANGRQEILRSDWEEAMQRVSARDDANVAWLVAAFADARRDNAKAVVLFIHSDPMDKVSAAVAGKPCGALQQDSCNPYLPFLARLTELAGDFDKPVLLVHGSTNKFCLDRGFGGWRAGKLWRLNGPGDFVTFDAAVVRIDPAARTPFEVHGLLSGDDVADCRPF